MGIKKRGIVNKKRKAILTDAKWLIVRNYAVGEAKPLLQEVRKRKKGDKFRKALINYLIVRTVSIFEIFHINMAYDCTSSRRRNARKLFTEIKTNATIADQIISSFSFMDLEQVNQVFSTMLDTDFFTEIKNQSVRYAPDYYIEREHISHTRLLHKNWDYVCSIFDIRHDIVHHNKPVDLKYSEIRDLIGGLMEFMMCSLMIIPHKLTLPKF